MKPRSNRPRAVRPDKRRGTVTSALSVEPASATAPPTQLVQFVLNQARVRTNVCSLQHHRSGYQLARRTVTDYNLIYVLEHRAVWVLGDEPHDLRAGQLIIVPPNLPHHGYSTGKRIKLVSVHIELTLPGGQDVFELIRLPLVQSVVPDSPLDQYLRGAAAEFARASQDERLRMLPSWGRMIALELISDNHRRGLLEHRTTEPLVAQVLDELRKRADQPLTLGQLSQWSGYTPQHLNRVFRRVLGVTPLQQHTQLRMERAAEKMLDDPHLQIAQIARSLGFDDPFHFSRLFRKIHGQSPAKFRLATLNQERPQTARLP